MNFRHVRSAGFTLIELAAVLLVVGLMAGFGMQAAQVSTNVDCYAKTREQLRVIRESIQRFSDNNGRLPLPAGRSLGVTDPNYGREAGTVTTSTVTYTSGVTDRLATGAYATNPVAFGALPFQALQLPTSFATDCWGNKFSYVVAEKFLTTSGYLSTTDGPIDIRRGTLGANVSLSNKVFYTVISHGADAVGAVRGNYTGASHGWCSVGTRIDSENCDLTNAILYYTDQNNGTNPANFSDDLLAYSPKPAFTSNAYCWGVNNANQLGDGSTTNRFYPLPVRGSIKFSKLYGNGNSFCGLSEDNTAYCWGSNGSRQLGDVNCNGCATGGTTLSTPTVVPGGFKFSMLNMNQGNVTCGIAAAGGTGVAGRIYCWGQDNTSAGTRSLGNTSLSSAFYGWPQPLGGAAATKTFSNIFATSYTICGIEAGNGHSWCWLRGSAGQFGTGVAQNGTGGTDPVENTNGLSMRKMVFANSSGVIRTCALTTTNRLYCWGNNNNGQLGIGHPGYGSGYVIPPLITFTYGGGGGGGGAAATARVLNGGIIAIDIINPGSNYAYAPVTYVNGVISIAGATIDQTGPNAGKVTSVTVSSRNLNATEVSGGRFYSDVATVDNTVCAIEMGTNKLYCWGAYNSGSVGNGLANASNNISGYNYTSAPTVVFSGGGTGVTTAAATATYGSGGITALTLTNTGDGYTTAPKIVFTGGGGAGYGISATPDMGGPILSVTVTDPSGNPSGGSGYTDGSYAIPNSDIIEASNPLPTLPYTLPTGCTATVAGGTVTDVTCATAGNGLNRPTISLNSLTASAGGGTGASARFNVAQTQVVYIALNFNNGDEWVPKLVSGPVTTFTGIMPGISPFTGLGTDGKLYSWGTAGGGSNRTGIAASITSVPTLLNGFVKTNACTVASCGTPDTTAASINFGSLCPMSTQGDGALFCALDTTGKSYMWGPTRTGDGHNASNPIPNATCADNPAPGVPACNYRWSIIAGGSGSSSLNACGIRIIP